MTPKERAALHANQQQIAWPLNKSSPHQSVACHWALALEMSFTSQDSEHNIWQFLEGALAARGPCNRGTGNFNNDPVCLASPRLKVSVVGPA